MKEYRLVGAVTLPIEIIVECDSKKIAPSEFAEQLILKQGFVHPEHISLNPVYASKIDFSVTKSGTIKFNDVQEIDE
ncbi:MAG: hypothetical protein IMF12_00115 [Proteobacteria bacterium]|nr:hypothetical protein [Pseudomonadota bacterium]